MLKKLKQKFVNWLLKGVHLQELHIGEHSVVISATGANLDGQKIENVGAPDSADDAPRNDTIDTKIGTHEEKTTGVHGVGESTVCSETEAKSYATKEFFVPIYGGTDITLYGAMVDTAGDVAWMCLLVPQDFTTLTDLEVIFQCNETGASMNFVITTYYSAYNGGEAFSAHTETADPRDVGATVANEHLAHSISDLVDAVPLAAGDFLLVVVTFDDAVIDSNARVRGLRLKYT